MPEATATEHLISQEKAKPSAGLMLHIAHGEFDEAKAATLDKKPTVISPRSFAILEAQHRQVQEEQQKTQYDLIRKNLKEQGASDEGIAPEMLRHRHMLAWAKSEERVIQAIFTHQRENHFPMQQALKKLGITISLEGGNTHVADQFYKMNSNTSGTPGSFYENFCKSGDLNKKLLDVLGVGEMIALKDFLAGTLGSWDAYNALLATRQTYDAIEHNELASGNLALKDSDKSILGFFQKGEQLLPNQSQEEHSKPEKVSSPILGVGISENQGRRPEMEDAHVIERALGGNPGQEFYAIYDGHGGRAVADKAAQQLHQIFIAALKQGLPPSDALRIAYQQTDRSMQDAEIPGGATALTAFIEGDSILIASLGDARAVLIHGNNQAERLSRDRKANDPAEQQAIQARGGTIAQGRVVGEHGLLAVSAALGDFDYRGIQKSPDIRQVTRQPDDKVLVLACDGIWDKIQDDEVAGIIGNETDPQKASDLLVQEAYNRGSGDNLSAIVLKLS